MRLEHGMASDHLATLVRAYENHGGKSFDVWSGDLRRNPYLLENINFGVERGLIKTKEYDRRDAQESGLTVSFTAKMKGLLDA